jgi:hypothetical protein
LHCTPTSGSWLNLVEAFFSIITRQALRRGNFPTVADLIAAIERFIDAWNDRCTPFAWTKDPDTSSPKPPTRDAARRKRRQIRSTRTGWLLVRRTTLTSPSRSMARVVSKTVTATVRCRRSRPRAIFCLATMAVASADNGATEPPGSTGSCAMGDIEDDAVRL